MKILITGGCGYTGTILTNSLIKKDYKVKVVDTQWFGNYLLKNEKLEVLKKDVRNIEVSDLKNIDKVVHLANIANDPSVELNSKLSWEVNVLATQRLIEYAVKNKVKQ